MKRVLIIIMMALLVAPQPARANSGKAFMMSVIYVTLAGTLVGAATLAFTTSPSGNLNNVARGASFGLYAGILMGLYVNSLDDQAPVRGEQGPGGLDNQPPPPVPENPDQAPDQNQTKNILPQELPSENLHLAFKPFLVAPPTQADQRWGMGVHFLEAKF